MEFTNKHQKVFDQTKMFNQGKKGSWYVHLIKSFWLIKGLD